jgi:hypothetical protein
MGLDTTHGCWHGAYSAFNRWRKTLAKLAGIPLDLMEGYWHHDWSNGVVFNDALEWAKPREGGPMCANPRGPVLVGYIERVDAWLPLKWDAYRSDPLTILLDHSDAEGYLTPGEARKIADRLEELLPELAKLTDDGGHIGNWVEKTQRFIDGCRLAHSKKQRVVFG